MERVGRFSQETDSMAGHSKWSNIKRRKGAVDAKRGKLFTKLSKEITTAARLGGGDASANPRLRAGITAAKKLSMPADNIERAVKKGTGEIEGPPVEEIQYEGYGAGGVAFFVEAQTDNRNRTTAQVRSAFTKNVGNLGASGSVGWMFKKRGLFTFEAESISEEVMMDAALEAGADDVNLEGETWVVLSEPSDFASVLDHFENSELQCQEAEFTMLPDNTIAVSGKEAEQVLRLMEKLEDLDDVMKVYANFEISDDEIERIFA
jgi:YebC/PmpR family DNA-binding regulatory protein